MRLLDTVDDLARRGVFDSERVLIQSGNNPDFKTLNCENKPFCSMDEFEECLKNASLVISHAGCGTLLQAIRLGKVPIVMPRRKKYNEHVNDHQMQLVQALVEQGRVVAALEPEDLPEAMAQARRLSAKPHPAQPTLMLDTVRKAIKELTSQ
jgi:beta-1,4-N-acetylglucosaminyltransferase